MTRKDARREAIHIVSNARIGKQRKVGIIAALELCQQEPPFSSEGIAILPAIKND